MANWKRPTVRELYATIDEMRKAYPFMDKNSWIDAKYSPETSGAAGIEIRTTDEKSGTEVILWRKFKFLEEDKNEF